jgi:L-asparaginase
VVKRVLLVATGDTIAYQPGRSRVATGADLLAAAGTVPVRVTVEDLMAEPSWDISPSTMLAVARRVRQALAGEGFDGVVVTHGVDTLEQTAFLTDLLVDVRGGIVFTGAFRYLDDPASDGPRNVADSLTTAADPLLRNAGAVLCLNGELHAARWAVLAEATRFTSDPLLGHVVGAGVDLAVMPPDRFGAPKGEPETDVALVKTYPGMPAAIINAAVDAGARGVVLEGTGAGSVPVELFTTISELSEWDIPVVVASRARTRGERSLGVSLAASAGAISARGLSASHARVALMVALGAGGVDAVRSWFDQFQTGQF